MQGPAGRSGTVLAAVALATGLLMILHGALPDVGGLGSLVETFLPWCCLVLLVLGVLAVRRRAGGAGLAVLFASGIWLWVCWPFSAATPAPRPNLVVVHHNVADTNTDVAGTVAVLLEPEPDVVTLVEVTPQLDEELTEALAAALPYRAVQGTVGVWSRFPLVGAEPVDLRPPDADVSWDRGLRVVVDTVEGADVRVYAVHSPSVRLGAQGFGSDARDASLRRLADVLAEDTSTAIVVGGDLNTTLADRALDPVLEQVATPRGSFGFTFPSTLPVVRIDHVLARGAEVTRVATLGRTGSDHRPVLAEVALPSD
ncbi:endonuclease/exonuclease/phosphatase family protein [Isoptericola sp. S6320L]|uniref:endonuclease/exonuclease/phosphatase family protein n=1 Tax=Isoptericola sp. S6320L TaxID=2926411 RepID=UPI001FF304CA|nr:endonuclease/exonuclease/phosphatase family protein [Isoptericola sp. S6320L]MCK0118733.1 endonuclease/exonuclease/phosphatase family protein [Isoptericola sp. S6320L]